MIDEREIRYRMQFYQQDIQRAKEQRRLRRLALCSQPSRAMRHRFEIWRWLQPFFRRATPKKTAPTTGIPSRCSAESSPI